MLHINVRSLKTTKSQIVMGQVCSINEDDLGNTHDYVIQLKPKVLEIVKPNAVKENPREVANILQHANDISVQYLLKNYNDFLAQQKQEVTEEKVTFVSPQETKSIIEKHNQKFAEYMAQQYLAQQEPNTKISAQTSTNQVDIDRHFENSKKEEDYLETNPHEYALYYLPEIKEAIKKVGVKVVKMDLHCEGESMFMNEVNLPKFLTKNTPEPIFVGYNKKEKCPVMIVRYIDEINNKTLNLENATSCVFIIIVYIPHVGLEPMTMEYGPTKIDGKIGMIQKKCDMNLDGGQGINKYVVNLIEGKLPGKRIR